MPLWNAMQVCIFHWLKTVNFLPGEYHAGVAAKLNAPPDLIWCIVNLCQT